MRSPRLPRDPVTIGLAAMLTLMVILAVASYLNTRNVNEQSYNRCMDRQGNTQRLNEFVHRMTRLESGNQFIDQSLRTQRVAAYRGLVLEPPKCGPRP